MGEGDKMLLKEKIERIFFGEIREDPALFYQRINVDFDGFVEILSLNEKELKKRGISRGAMEIIKKVQVELKKTGG